MSGDQVLMDADRMRRTTSRIAHEILERNPEPDSFALAGIHTRGVPLAMRLAALIEKFAGEAPPVGTLDIALYRDDVGVGGRTIPLVGETSIGFDPAAHTVVLVDDVLYTGRTIRAAIDALFDYGRPPSVQLAVLIDRGHRELPIRPDYVGQNLPTAVTDHVTVRLEEIDGVDEVILGVRGAS